MNQPDDISDWTVRTLVNGRCLPELEETYAQINATFKAVNSTSHLDELDYLMGQVNDQEVDPMDIVPGVDDILRMAAEVRLNQIGVELSPEIPITMLAEALDILLTFDPTDTPSLVIDEIDAAEDEDDALCRILSMFGTYEANDWVPHLLEVNDRFSGNVRLLCVQALEKGTVTDIESPVDHELLKRLSRLVKANGDSLGAEMVNTGAGLGVSMESLYALHVGHLINVSVEQAVDDLYSLAAISCESGDGRHEKLQDCLNDLFHDFDTRQVAERHRIQMDDKYKGIFGDANA